MMAFILLSWKMKTFGTPPDTMERTAIPQSLSQTQAPSPKRPSCQFYSKAPYGLTITHSLSESLSSSHKAEKWDRD